MYNVIKEFDAEKEIYSIAHLLQEYIIFDTEIGSTTFFI